MKRKFLFAIIAVVSAMLMPLAATSQVAPDRPARAEQTETPYKWKVFAGAAYTSLNQVDQSENGLIGVNASVTRDFGKYFGLMADGGYYAYTYDRTNPGNPTVEAVLFGPEIHADLFARLVGSVHVLLGGEHTSTDTSSGFTTIPNVSFAGGFGGALDYKLSQRFALRATGDDILSSFVQEPTNSQLGYSPHLRRNSRAAFGFVYRF